MQPFSNEYDENKNREGIRHKVSRLVSYGIMRFCMADAAVAGDDAVAVGGNGNGIDPSSHSLRRQICGG